MFSRAISRPTAGLSPSPYSSGPVPSLTSRPIRGPLPSAMMLVAIVADQRITATWASSAVRSANPSTRAPSFRHSKKQTVKSCGVVSTLTGVTVVPSENRPSVSVPPMSTSTV